MYFRGSVGGCSISFGCVTSLGGASFFGAISFCVGCAFAGVAPRLVVRLGVGGVGVFWTVSSLDDSESEDSDADEEEDEEDDGLAGTGRADLALARVVRVVVGLGGAFAVRLELGILNQLLINVINTPRTYALGDLLGRFFCTFLFSCNFCIRSALSSSDAFVMLPAMT